MKASIVDLRYRMNDVLKALERNEDVHILYHGKTKGILKATPGQSKEKVSEHLFLICSKARKRLTRRWIGYAADGTVIFDTDIFIWVQRGNKSAAKRSRWPRILGIAQQSMWNSIPCCTDSGPVMPSLPRQLRKTTWSSAQVM